MESDVSALIVGKPGQLRHSLQILLRSVSELGMVYQADDGESALGEFADHPPDLLLLDTSLLGQDVWATLRQIRTAWPHAQCLVLVDDAWQQRQAESAGADAALTVGSSATRLLEIVRTLLDQ